MLAVVVLAPAPRAALPENFPLAQLTVLLPIFTLPEPLQVPLTATGVEATVAPLAGAVIFTVGLATASGLSRIAAVVVAPDFTVTVALPPTLVWLPGW